MDHHRVLIDQNYKYAYVIELTEIQQVCGGFMIGTHGGLVTIHTWRSIHHMVDVSKLVNFSTD